jgi:hypothetical protein
MSPSRQPHPFHDAEDVVTPVEAASQITVTFCGVYFLTLLNQFVQKRLLVARYKREGRAFDRYEAAEMRHHDRLTANMLEWTPCFLGPLWCLAVNGRSSRSSGGPVLAEDTTVTSLSSSASLLSDTCVAVAWTYVGLRILYFGLILRYGVAGSGQNVALWAATLPGYACLMYLLAQAFVGVKVMTSPSWKA